MTYGSKCENNYKCKRGKNYRAVYANPWLIEFIAINYCSSKSASCVMARIAKSTSSSLLR